MCWLVVDAVKPGALPLDPAPAESPFPCGGLVSYSALARGGTGIKRHMFPKTSTVVAVVGCYGCCSDMFGDAVKRRTRPRRTRPQKANRLSSVRYF